MQQYCTQCGSPLPDDAKFCQHCGARIEQPADTDQQSTEENQQSVTHQLGAVATELPSFEYDAKGSQIVKTKDEQGKDVVEFRSLHPNAVILFMLSYMKTTGVILILFIIVAVLEMFSSSTMFTLIAVPVYFLILYLFANLAYKNYRYEVTDDAFIVEYGILQKQKVSIPCDRIQNINIQRGLLDRMLGLAHLDIETAATGGTVVESSIGGQRSVSEGYIPGISVQEAEDLRTVLLHRADK